MLDEYFMENPYEHVLYYMLVYLSLLIYDPEDRDLVPDIKVYQCMNCGRYYVKGTTDTDEEEGHDDQLDPPYCLVKEPVLIYHLNPSFKKKTKQLLLEA